MAHEDWLGPLSIGKPPPETTGASPADRPPPSSVRRPPSRTSIFRAARSRPSPLPETGDQPMGPDEPFGHRRSNRYREVFVSFALGNKACREGFSLLWKRARRLFADLGQARGEGRLPRYDRARTHQSDYHRRRGTRAALRRPSSRPARIVDDRYDKGSADHASARSAGTTLSEPQPWPTRHWTASFTRPRIELKGHRCAEHLVAAERPPLHQPAVLPIAHGGPQRLPARAAPSLAQALHGTQTPLHGLHRTIRSKLDPALPCPCNLRAYVDGMERLRDHHAGL